MYNNPKRQESIEARKVRVLEVLHRVKDEALVKTTPTARVT